MTDAPPPETRTAVGWLVRVCLDNKLVVGLLFILLAGWGISVAPFDWTGGGMPRDPVPADAIPDVSQNQQIVFSEWPGRSPRDVDNQITYPLSAALMGIPEVKTVRCQSMFGFSSIYVIFSEKAEFYWARARILEKLNSLAAGTLPPGVQPRLGPDATALGQVFWYTLEGRDPQGRTTGGWDLHELRTVQDYTVRYALMSVEGVSEVASCGGFVQEYQIDVDPELLRAFGVALEDVVRAVRNANTDVGANTLEINKVEYVIRGVGFAQGLSDLRKALITTRNGLPVFVENVARVALGPATRRGALDKGGAEAVGGVVVVRFGANPAAVIAGVKRKIEEIAPGLPARTLPDGTVSRIRIVPFYDRSGLIRETLGTLQSALQLEVLVTVVVIIVMLGRLWSSLVVSVLLPLAVLLCFVAMRVCGVQANVVALSGIAIAIGTMVDMGIIVVENIHRHLEAGSQAKATIRDVIVRASSEVGGAVLTAVATTLVSFLPVLAMEGLEGKLFRPLVFTKTAALAASIILTLAVLPPLMHVVLSRPAVRRRSVWVRFEGLVYAGVAAWFFGFPVLGVVLAAAGLYGLVAPRVPDRFQPLLRPLVSLAAAMAVFLLLARAWAPLGAAGGPGRNLIFVALVVGGALLVFEGVKRAYPRLLGWCLDHKRAFLAIPAALVLLGALIWLGFGTLFGWLPSSLKATRPVSAVAHAFPGLGREFMPPLDEGAFLFMPVTMPHASIGEALDVVGRQDRLIQAVPEVSDVVGKIGRVDSALDPAPVSMIETVVNYHPEYLGDERGGTPRFRYDPGRVDWFRDRAGQAVPAPDGRPYLVRGRFARDEHNRLIPDRTGAPFRLWRRPLFPSLNPGRAFWAGIGKPDDIWAAISAAANLPGTTMAPHLQPISARIVMLQSGIAAAMGVRIVGPDLESIETFALRVQEWLRQLPAVNPETVVADRIIGTPYVEFHIDREAAAQYGVSLQEVQDTLETAVGGRVATTTVEGRERYVARVRYARDRRDELDLLGKVLVTTPQGAQVPLNQMAELRHVRGPMMIKSENTFPVGHVLFDKRPGFAAVDAVEQAQAFLKAKVDQGELILPAGVSYSFTGDFENQRRAERRLQVIVPVAFIVIFLILYLQFRTVGVASLVFSGIAVAWAGGMIMIWLYGRPWFLDFYLLGVNLQDVFGVHPVNLSIAIWVGFLALFGIASDDGVVMATYLEGAFRHGVPATVAETRTRVIEAAGKRVRPCLMTTATTILALLPVLTATGRGADIMRPMALPAVGGMTLVVITMFTVPVLYCAMKERQATLLSDGRARGS